MDRPQELPNRLECSYCKRNREHGGECLTKDMNRRETGCLYFTMDERGCIRNTDSSISFSLYREIPYLNMWDTGWSVYGNETEIKIKKIYGLSWDQRKGILKVKCNYDYYINEFSEGYQKEKNMPDLKVIK